MKDGALVRPAELPQIPGFLHALGRITCKAEDDICSGRGLGEHCFHATLKPIAVTHVHEHLHQAGENYLFSEFFAAFSYSGVSERRGTKSMNAVNIRLRIQVKQTANEPA